MNGKKKSKTDRILSAALFKIKYQMLTGKLDSGFEVIYKGVLQDLSLTALEVDEYIEKNRQKIDQMCLESS